MPNKSIEKRRESWRKSSQEYRLTHADECKEYGKDWVKLHKEKVNYNISAYRKKLKNEAIRFYGGKCACCGENHEIFLTIDHINGNGNKHRKELGNQKIYYWLKVHKYPSGFRVLCMNCNWARGVFGYCPHERKAENALA